jgi:hypothetical protein
VEWRTVRSIFESCQYLMKIYRGWCSTYEFSSDVSLTVMATFSNDWHSTVCLEGVRQLGRSGLDCQVDSQGCDIEDDT